MKTRQLGQNGLEVSAISLGCMNFTGFYGPTDKQESFACLDAARDHGINSWTQQNYMEQVPLKN